MRRPDIEIALRGRTLSLFGSWRELRKLPEYLYPNEQVLDVTAGIFGTTGGRSLIAATDQRVFIVKDGWIFKNTQSLSYYALRSVDNRTGFFFATLEFIGEGIEIPVRKVGRWSAKRITKLIREKIAAHESDRSAAEHAIANAALRPETSAVPVQPVNPLDFTNPQPAASAPGVSEDPFFDKIERLSVLHKQGVLSDEEFQAAKARMLNQY